MNSAASDLVAAGHCEIGQLSVKLISHRLFLGFNFCPFASISYVLVTSNAYGTS